MTSFANLRLLKNAKTFGKVYISRFSRPPGQPQDWPKRLAECFLKLLFAKIFRKLSPLKTRNNLKKRKTKKNLISPGRCRGTQRWQKRFLEMARPQGPLWSPQGPLWRVSYGDLFSSLRRHQLWSKRDSPKSARRPPQEASRPSRDASTYIKITSRGFLSAFWSLKNRKNLRRNVFLGLTSFISIFSLTHYEKFRKLAPDKKRKNLRKSVYFAI